jgi:hypothetical protein
MPHPESFPSLPPADRLDVHSKVIRGLHDYGKLPGYAEATRPEATQRRRTFESDEAFWKAVIAREVVPGDHVALLASSDWSGFRLAGWVPRAPGLYWKTDSSRLRNLAERDVISKADGYTVYGPGGKSWLMLGGMGSVRFSPAERTRLLSASSSGEGWTGVPVLLREEAFDRHRFIEDGVRANLKGVLAAIPREYTEHLGGTAGLPRVCLEIADATGIEPFSGPSDYRYFQGCAWTLFEHRPNGESPARYDYAHYTFNAIGEKGLGDAVQFLHDYVGKRQGTMFTDFDEEVPRLGGFVELPLSELKNSEVSRPKLRRLIDRVVNETMSDASVRYDQLSTALSRLNESELRMFTSEYLDFDLDAVVGRTAGNEDRVAAILDRYSRRGEREALTVGLVTARPDLTALLATP